MSGNLVAIYVETPYQLITSLNIAKNYLKADGCYLFLMEKYYMSENKFVVSATHPFIRGVYYINDYNEVGWFRHHLLNIKGLFKGFPPNDYTNMVCYYKTMPKKMPDFSSIICNKYEVLYARRYNSLFKKNAKVYVIEDGTGDYVNDFIDVPEGYNRIYYWSELYNSTFCQTSIEAPRISINDKELKDIILDVYQLSDTDKEKLKTCKCIYFHQVRDMKDDDRMEEIELCEQSILEALNDKFADSFYVKLHPRDDGSIFPDYQKLSTDIPWEALLYYFQNVDDLVLVGLYSTTLVTPKNTFNLEPYVISTLNIFDYWKDLFPEATLKRMYDMFDYFKSEYNHPSKVAFPTSKEEFIACLNNI